MPPSMKPLTFSICLLLVLTFAAQPAHAFGAGYVARGSHAKGVNYRHGDILASVYFLRHVHATHIRQIYFGNWLRDFSQLIDRQAIELIPEPILRAVVAVFAYVQFGYSTGAFEVTTERLGCYRPEEHIDNPRGYEGVGVGGGGGGSAGGGGGSGANVDARYAQLRSPVLAEELDIQSGTAMKNYVANQSAVQGVQTSLDFIEKQLIAAVACGRARNSEAYLHLGAALHTLEDFVAHSNWLELCLQMLGAESRELPHVEEMRNVFAFTGGAAKVRTKRGSAPPLVTGTFGALDLYQSLFGEVDDKLTAMSLPGLRVRMKGPQDSLSTASKALIGLLKGVGSPIPDFIDDITSIAGSSSLSSSSTDNEPADWGKLNDTPTLLWDLIKPILRIRDKVAQWVYDHLMIDAVANALAAISAAIDKLVYMALGVVLNPVLTDISAILAKQSADLLVKDQTARRGVQNHSDPSPHHGIRRDLRDGANDDDIFSPTSTATDPTHSQLCKDHYGHPLNELAGLVAVKVTTATIKKIIELWQPGSTRLVKPALDEILQTLHHPWNYSMESDLQSLMVAQVFNWCSAAAAEAKNDKDNDVYFARKLLLEGLDRDRQAAKNGLEAGGREMGQSHFHSHPHPHPHQHDAAVQPTMVPMVHVGGRDEMGGTVTATDTAHALTTTAPGGGGVRAPPHPVPLPAAAPAATASSSSAPHPGHTNPTTTGPSLPVTASSSSSAPAPAQPSASTDRSPQPNRPPSFVTERITANISRAVSLRPSSNDKSSDAPNPSDDDETLLPRIRSALSDNPTGDVPNPIDTALSLLPPGLVPLTTVFAGIENEDVVAAEGMGMVLKDGVMALRLREEEGSGELERRRGLAHREVHAAMGGAGGGGGGGGVGGRRGDGEELSVKELLGLLDLKCGSAGSGGGDGGDGGGLGGNRRASRGEGPEGQRGDGSEGRQGQGGSGHSSGNKVGKLMARLSISRSNDK